MYAAIRQGKAKTGMAEELTRRIKEGAIPIISDVPGFVAYYVVYAPDDTVTAISIFNDYAEPKSQTDVRSRGSSRILRPSDRASYSVGRAGDRAHPGVARTNRRSVILCLCRIPEAKPDDNLGPRGEGKGHGNAEGRLQ